MKYSLMYSEKAQKQLNKLDNSMKSKILKYIDQNLFDTDNPKKFGKALRYNLKGFWRYRVENYRIIVEINDTEITIFILEVEHRSKIYKKI